MKPYVFVCTAALLAACDRPHCNNTDPVFDKFAPTAPEYKAELARRIAATGRNRLRYFIDAYSRDSAHEYMSVYIQGDALCAKGLLDITHTGDLANYKRVQGTSYNGAELRGLQYYIDSADGAYNLVAESVAWIAD